MSTFSDKHAIVLDVGTRYVKCGVSEERGPRCVISWEIATLLAEREDTRTIRAYLANQLHKICFDLMHVNPRHRRFLVCEDVLGPRSLREALVDVLFVDLKVASVTLVPSALSALYATSHHTALILDCGHTETRLLPVYKGIPLLHYFSGVPVGTASCCKHLQQAMVDFDSQSTSLTRDQAEHVLERACFVQPLQSRIMEVADTKFRMHGCQSIVIPASLRSEVCENLFVDSEQFGASVVSCVDELLERLPVDLRAALVENILVLGGTSMIPGFCERLREELMTTVGLNKQRLSERVAVVCPLFPRNVLAWVGASIFAATDASKESTISANEYTSSGSRSLPDWTSIAETEI